MKTFNFFEKFIVWFVNQILWLSGGGEKNMTITRKAYEVRFGEEFKNKEYDFDSKIVMAETAERAIEVAKECFSKKRFKTMFVKEVKLLVDGFDRD